jgi:hypothetical protein
MFKVGRRNANGRITKREINAYLIPHFKPNQDRYNKETYSARRLPNNEILLIFPEIKRVSLASVVNYE